MPDMSGCTALLLDIEGTTTPITFVTEVLFPYAQKQYAPFIRSNWDDEQFQSYKEAFVIEDKNLGTDPEKLIQFVEQKHKNNEKHTAFKALQGHLWKSGYEDGSLKSIVYVDVPAAIRKLDNHGIKTYIYSSGSIPAQKLLFKYSDQGDLTPLLSGYNDTSTAGSKLDAASYTKISKTIEIEPCQILFLSDNVREVDAARKSGMQAWVVERPGNAPLTAEERANHRVISNFDVL